MDEQLNLWEPIAHSEGLYYLYKLCDSHKGLELIFIHEKIRSKKMLILFEHSVVAYTSTNETLVFGSLSERYGEILHKGCKFFITKNSDFIKKISRSTSIIDTDNWKHFLFITLDEVTEVISTAEPKVSWITYDLPKPSRNDNDE